MYGGQSGGALNQFNEPIDVFVKNDTLYVADHNNYRVMRWDPGATQGIMVAGTGQRGNELKELRGVYDVIVDDKNNIGIGVKDDKEYSSNNGNKKNKEHTKK